MLDTAICNINLAADKVGFTAISAVGASGDLVLAEITFEAIGIVGDTSTLTLNPTTFSDPAGQPIEVITHNGSILIPGVAVYLPLVLR